MIVNMTTIKEVMESVRAEEFEQLGEKFTDYIGLIINIVLPLLESDLFTIMQAVTEERLADVEVKFSSGAACCVIMASKGYPESYEKGYEITIPSEVFDSVYVAGAVLKDGKLLTSGGRVLGVTAIDDKLESAIDGAYARVDKISFGNAFYRHDIGQRALKAKTEKGN